jgi:hypothetical protein
VVISGRSPTLPTSLSVDSAPRDVGQREVLERAAELAVEAFLVKQSNPRMSLPPT